MAGACVLFCCGWCKAYLFVQLPNLYQTAARNNAQLDRPRARERLRSANRINIEL